MRLRITQSLSGSVDGVDLSKYREGVTYELGTTLANYLLSERWAVPDDVAPAPPAAPRRIINTPSVLIVEDDHDMQLILSQLLQHHGLSSYCAADGLEGLAALAQHRPSLVLLDLAMPRMDGFAFRAAQRGLSDRRLANVPVVVVSAVHDAPKYRSTLNAAEVLLKPFDVDRLIAAVKNHVRPASLFRW